jgi:hypothetical protein
MTSTMERTLTVEEIGDGMQISRVA